MAVLAPMPKASVRIAAAAKPGERRICRHAYFTSWSNVSMQHARPDVPDLFLDRLDAIQLDHRAAPRLAGLDARGDLLIDQQIERRLHLVVEIAFDAIAMAEVAPEAARRRESAIG